MESLSKVVMALLDARRTVAFLEGALNAKRRRIAELERAQPEGGQAAP
jgi:hypothetical protein